jgi:hypothetical protein
VGVKCTGVKRNGEPCKAWAVRGSDPPLCGAHGGGKGRPGPPLGSKNAEKHGAYSDDGLESGSLEEHIEDLAKQIRRLSKYIGSLGDKDSKLPGLMKLHAEMVSRLGRIRVQSQQLDGGGNKTMEAIKRASEILRKNWGVEL